MGSKRSKYGRLSELSDDESENGSGVEDTTAPRQTRYKFDKDEQDEVNEEIQEVKEAEDGEDNAEDDVFGDSPSSEGEKDADDDNYSEGDDDQEDDEISSKTRRRAAARRGRPRITSDDSDFDDNGDMSEDDEYFERLKEKKFIASEDDESDSFGYSKPTRRKRKSRSASLTTDRKRTRSLRTRSSKDQSEKSGNEESEEQEDSIQKEIEELYDSSPSQTPVKHKLRDRSKIDYTIPPPITNDLQLEGSTVTTSYMASVPKPRGRRPNINKNEYRKILFPTAGPFGGSDVISLFGTNIPPGGIPIPGMANDTSMVAIGQNLGDSDSSEDEIAPINGDPSITKKTTSANDTTSKLLAGGSNEQKNKNSLSDTDPLGIDMDIDFSAVGGLDNYINQLKEMVALPLSYPELYQNFSITPPRGVLFHGPPGTGKTLMARALAASCSTSQRKITFFMRKGADCLSKWVGEAERQLRLLFEEAKNQQPSIIFFDEIDGLAPVRSSKQEQIHASIVSTLLALMDGMDNRGQVIVIGATNRPDSVDPALRRPGRFDREFYFPLPDVKARNEILKIHTKQWSPPLSDPFIEKISELTKGYGGADLRALCTEAALNSIQRKYPQIYSSNEKLKVNPSKIKVIAADFMKAVEKIVPSSARSSSLESSPLPQNVRPLLKNTFQESVNKIADLMPDSISNKKKLTTLEESMYLDPSVHDEDGGFGRQQLLKALDSSRVCKPYLLVCGESGSGQQYLGSAILNHLEGYQVQSLDMANVFGDATRTPESAVVQAFIEARRHQPAIIFLPNIDTWFDVVPVSAKATLLSLLRSLKNSDKILLMGIADLCWDDLSSEIKHLFGYINGVNVLELKHPSKEERFEFFKTLRSTLSMKPHEFTNDLENRPKRKLKVLKSIPIDENNSNGEIDRKKLKQQEYEDTKLKNILKIKLAGLMDLFKNRYKRFRKPIIDENLLYHLFEPSILHDPMGNYEKLYEKSEDSTRPNMIKEISSGSYYYNMDLDVIEERLWNGYYSEPKQFLKDIKMIVQDSLTSGDRERILKANEMLTNAQFGIDEFSNPEFIQACKAMRQREVAKQEKILKEHEILQKDFKKRQMENIVDLTKDIQENSEGEQADKLNDSSAPDKNGSNTLSNGTEEKSVKEANGSSVPIKEEPAQGGAMEIEDSSSESEAEFNLHIDETRVLIMGDQVDDFFQHVLLELTNNFTLDQLEQIMASLMASIWNDRKNWDKRETVQKLYETAKAFSTST